MASIKNNNETVQLVKFLTGSVDKFKNKETLPELDAGTLYFAHSDLNKAESDNDENRPYKNAPYGYIVYDVPNENAAGGATRVVMGDHARITTYLENPIWLKVGGTPLTQDGHNVGTGASICLQGRASDQDESGADVRGSENNPFTLNYTDIGADLSSFWTQGQAEGPVLTLNVNGVSHAFDAIPAASGDLVSITTTDSNGQEATTEYDGVSGIVTTGEQSFAGAKTFKAPLTIEVPNTFYGTDESAFTLKGASDDSPNCFELSMIRQREGGPFRTYHLTVNNTTSLDNAADYYLRLGSQFRICASEYPGRDSENFVDLTAGNVVHHISTYLKSKTEQTRITTDLMNLSGKTLITPYYESNTVTNNQGELLSVGEYGLLTPYSLTLGDNNTPIYFDAGKPTECDKYAGGTRLNVNGADYTETATIYAPVDAPANSKTKWTVGWDGKKPYWMDSSNITPAALGNAAGSKTQPIYFAEGGVPTACSFWVLSGEPIWSSSFKVLGLKQGDSNSDEVRSYAASDCVGCIFIDTKQHIVYISNGLLWEGMNTYQ